MYFEKIVLPSVSLEANKTARSASLCLNNVCLFIRLVGGKILNILKLSCAHARRLGSVADGETKGETDLKTETKHVRNHFASTPPAPPASGRNTAKYVEAPIISISM